MEKAEVVKWSEHENELVDQIVVNWNSIVATYENSTIKFAVQLKELFKVYPEKTAKQIIDKVKDHPDLKPTISVDRIYQGWRLVENRPDIAKFVLEYTPKQLLELPREEQPILKRDGSVAVEHYFELYKRPGLIDESMKSHLEGEAKKNVWTVKQLKDRIRDITTDLSEPDQKTRAEKGQLIKEILGMLRTLPVEKIRGVKKFAEEIKED